MTFWPPSRPTLIVLIGAVLLLLLPPIAEALRQPFVISVATRVVILALVTVSLDLLIGFGGMVSLGHAAFFGVGAYATALLTQLAAAGKPLIWGWVPPVEGLVVWAVAIVVAALFGLVIGALALRTSGFNFIMITLAFAQMVLFLASLRELGGDDGLRIPVRNTVFGLAIESQTALYYVSLAALALYLFLCDRIVHSRFGMVLQAIAQNPRRAHALGYRAYSYQLVAFVIGAAGAGLAGALIANHARYVSPDLLVWTRSAEIMIMVILGGKGTLHGAVLGAAVLLLLEEFLIGLTEHWQVILGPILLVVVLTARRGLFGLLAGSRGGGGGHG